MKRLFFSLLLAGVLVGCAHNATPKTTPAPAQSPSSAAITSTALSAHSDADRLNAAKQWVESAHQVVETTGDAEAKEVLAFVRAHGIPSAPLAGGEARPLKGASLKVEPTFSLIVLYKDEDALGEPWSGYLSHTVGSANYNPQHHRMVLQVWGDLSANCKGVSVLHEGRHAKQYLTHPDMDWRDPKTFCCDERDTHRMQNRLFLRLGGKPYDDYVKAKVTWLGATTPQQQMTYLKEWGTKDDGLGSIFHPTSKDEYDFWNTSAFLDAQFRYIQTLPGTQEERDDAQAQFLHSLYRSSGIHE